MANLFNLFDYGYFDVAGGKLVFIYGFGFNKTTKGVVRYDDTLPARFDPGLNYVVNSATIQLSTGTTMSE